MKIDRELIENAKKDKEAFGEVYDFYFKPISSYIYRRCLNAAATEDITANCFFNVLKNIKNFKWKHENSFSGWIYKIATNCLNEYFRKESKYKFVAPESVESFFEDKSSEDELKDIEKKLDEKEEFLKVQEAIKKLDEKYQTIVHLRFFESLSYEEISEATGIKIGTLKSHLNRALKKLSATIGKY